MKPILLSAQLISKVEQAIETKVGTQYKESAFEQLDSNAGPWAITFLASHLWLADCAANGYKAIANRMQVPEWWLRVRQGEDLVDVDDRIDNPEPVTSASISETVATSLDDAQSEGCILQDSQPPDEALKKPEDCTHYRNKKNNR